jgi:hypothetical protein
MHKAASLLEAVTAIVATSTVSNDAFTVHEISREDFARFGPALSEDMRQLIAAHDAQGLRHSYFSITLFSDEDGFYAINFEDHDNSSSAVYY